MNEVKVFLSKQFSLERRDYLKSLVIAALTAGLTAGWEVVELLVHSGSDFSWIAVFRAAIIGCGGYLIKNYAYEKTKIIATVPAATSEEAKTEIVNTLHAQIERQNAENH